MSVVKRNQTAKAASNRTIRRKRNRAEQIREKLLRPEFLERMGRHWERMQALGVTRPRPDEGEHLNRIIAGEG
jgi:hypothetical protein